LKIGLEPPARLPSTWRSVAQKTGPLRYCDISWSKVL